MENNKNKKTALIIGVILLVVILAALGMRTSRRRTGSRCLTWTER